MSSSTLTSSGASTSKNPISLRLYKVLSTNFDDYATREALDTLSELYGSGSTDQATNGDGSTTLGEHAAKARRSLRRDMENKLAESSGHFVKALGEVDEKLTALKVHIDAMHDACAEAENQLKSTNDASKSVLERAGNLRDERQEIETKKSIITLFLNRFTLSDTETEAITSRDVPVGPAFFAAMDKTERIREDCRVLMAGEDGAPTKAGLDIMALTSSHLEQGYDKILRFLGNEFRRTGKELQVEVMPTTREGVVRLKKRPELLNEALSILSETRQTALLNSFLTALTRGGPSGLPRPIELHAHDPLRYVGDMLAWVHQAIAAEHEFLEALFGRTDAKRMVGSVRSVVRRTGETGPEEDEWIAELMDLGVGRLCVPLKNRVLQTVKSQESSIVLYKIANLLKFYLVTMGRTVGFDAVLTKTLAEITDASYKTFETSIEAQSRTLLQRPLDLDDTSLTPPLFVLDHAQVLKEVMSVYQSSVLDEEEEALLAQTTLPLPSGSGIGAGKKDFEKILDVVVDPVVESVVMQSEEKRRARPRWDAGVWVVNCLVYLLGVLEPFEAITEKKRVGIQRVLEERIRALIDEHFTTILEETGLLEFYKTIRNPPTSEPLSRFPQTSPSALRSALHIFSLWLSSSSIILPPPRLTNLTQAALASRVHQAALKRVVRVYEEVCGVVRDGKKGGYEAGETVVGSERPWGRGEVVRKILGVEESEDEEGSDEESEEESEESGEEESGEEDGDEESEEEDSEEGGDGSRQPVRP